MTDWSSPHTWLSSAPAQQWEKPAISCDAQLKAMVTKSQSEGWRLICKSSHFFNLISLTWLNLIGFHHMIWYAFLFFWQQLTLDWWKPLTGRAGTFLFIRFHPCDLGRKTNMTTMTLSNQVVMGNQIKVVWPKAILIWGFLLTHCETNKCV